MVIPNTAVLPRISLLLPRICRGYRGITVVPITVQLSNREFVDYVPDPDTASINASNLPETSINKDYGHTHRHH